VAENENLDREEIKRQLAEAISSRDAAIERERVLRKKVEAFAEVEREWDEFCIQLGAKEMTKKVSVTYDVLEQRRSRVIGELLATVEAANA
jgi:hypothetical protein